ncbi:peptidase M76 family-domain-containing protein [Pavlovales sp. CCMP2436]|nr:peptidase M76 family-domain-containing protein [Pavlovales sp. CCMP2436]
MRQYVEVTTGPSLRIRPLSPLRTRSRGLPCHRHRQPSRLCLPIATCTSIATARPFTRGMTWGGSEPKPAYMSSAPGRQPEAEPEEFGWAPGEIETGQPPSGRADGWVPASGDGWVPETGESQPPRQQGGAVSLDDEDDSRWRLPVPVETSPPQTAIGGAAVPPGEAAELLRRCEGWAQSAQQKTQPSALLRAIKAGGCNALAGGIKPVMCGPKGPRFDGVAAYYRAQTGRVLLCADRLKSEEETAAALSHELVHAYDHCRKGLRIPLVRTQVPWALDCPSEACSEVRAYSLATYADAPPWVDKRNLVYRSALQSMLSNVGSQCSDGEKCASVLTAIFERCAADASPFNDEGRHAEQRRTYPAMDLPPP